jgi:hypothetical protein
LNDSTVAGLDSGSEKIADQKAYHTAPDALDLHA